MTLSPLVSPETEIEPDPAAAPEAAAADVSPKTTGGTAPSRVLGRKIDEPSGKWLVVVAGIHGNEPAGVEALRRVFRALDESGERLPGAFVGFAGNLGALAARKR